MMASRTRSVYAATRGLSRVLHHHSLYSSWVFYRQQNPHKSFNFTSPYSTNSPDQNVDKTSKDAVKDVSWNLWVPNQFSGGIYEALENYGIDLTELASRGIIDPVIGRDEEIERCIHILSQKTKNNPVIVGEAGVAKTAIAEGLAQRIYRGDVPVCLKNRQLFSVDIGSLLVGAMYTGQFEERIKHVIREVTASNGQIILFIDEIQTVVGAENSQNQNEA